MKKKHINSNYYFNDNYQIQVTNDYDVIMIAIYIQAHADDNQRPFAQNI